MLTREDLLEQVDKLICDFNSRCQIGSPPQLEDQPLCDFDPVVGAECLDYAREMYEGRDCSEGYAALNTPCADIWYSCQ